MSLFFIFKIIFNLYYILNINLNIADIKIVLTTIIIIYSLLIFPILLNGNLSFNNIENRINYSIKLFGVFKIIYGYFELDEEGIIVHLTKSKAILIKFTDILSIRKKFKPLKDYHLLKFNSTLDIDVSGYELNIAFITFYSFFVQILGEIFNISKPYFNLNNTINIYENSNVLNYKCNANLVFNLLMIIISALKIIVEKIIYAINNRTQQNKQRN